MRLEKASAGAERQQHRRPERGLAVVERFGDQVDHQAGAEIEDRGRRADAGFARSADEVGGRDRPCQQRRLGEVAEVELARPRPVLRFVEEQIDLREGQSDQPDPGQQREDQHANAKRRSAEVRGAVSASDVMARLCRTNPRCLTSVFRGRINADAGPDPGRLQLLHRTGTGTNRRTVAGRRACRQHQRAQTALHSVRRFAARSARSDMTPPRTRHSSRISARPENRDCGTSTAPSYTEAGLPGRCRQAGRADRRRNTGLPARA